MELVRVEQLLEKYLEATTTVAEEKELQNYFSGKEVAPHLEEYQAMFAYFSGAKDEQFTKQVPLKTRNNFIKWASVAAVLIFSFGMYWQYQATPDYTQEEIDEAKMVLAMLSNNFNKGTQSIGHLNTFSDGVSQINHIDHFEQQTNKLLRNE
ncbi:hypothetical protein [Spongiivirga citrea]|uniref:Uncharacterized protein n=1 Tax=Spongiivirga citrea TaxID=1481457 RepID=A0A6M0CJ53_9FLAO|nr:hypothetical protein [Spongiivirga citrea]NER17945.1 hypothetical protein [Spongiivirga citrea]